jgi:hypothetical protein
MAKANSTNTTIPADSWRDHQLRRRAKGAGKFRMKHGRYSVTKKTLHNGVVARAVLTALPEDLAIALEELCVLAAHHPSGFTHTPQMEAACRRVAAESEPAAIAMCLARADARERAYVAR